MDENKDKVAGIGNNMFVQRGDMSNASTERVGCWELVSVMLLQLVRPMICDPHDLRLMIPASSDPC